MFAASNYTAQLLPLFCNDGNNLVKKKKYIFETLCRHNCKEKKTVMQKNMKKKPLPNSLTV